MDMIGWLKTWLENDNTKIIYVLALILIANLIDFGAGWLNAKFNPAVKFSSSKAIYGIARKMLLFILCVFFIPIALLVPAVGIGALYVLFIGYLYSEVNSILNHFKMADDDKQTEPFWDFIKKIFKK